jgi:hypothetical protein
VLVKAAVEVTEAVATSSLPLQQLQLLESSASIVIFVIFKFNL